MLAALFVEFEQVSIELTESIGCVDIQFLIRNHSGPLNTSVMINATVISGTASSK